MDLLLTAHLRGELSPSESQRLSEWLEAHPAHVADLFAGAELDLGLEKIFGGRRARKKGGRWGIAAFLSSRRIAWVLGSAAALALAWYGFSSLKPEKPEAVARLKGRIGIVRLVSGSENRPAGAGDWIGMGENLETRGADGGADVVHGSQTLVHVAGNSLLRFPSSREIVIVRGSLTASAPPQNTRTPIRFRTPDALVEVLGTKFTLWAGADSRIEMAEGSVQFTRSRDAKTVRVQAGYSVSSSDLVVRQSNVAPTREFSDDLSPYPDHPTATSRSAEEIYARTSPGTSKISQEDSQTRKRIIEMYRAAKVDLSLDRSELLACIPKTWSKATPEPLSGEFRQPHSVDAPFYHRIPSDSKTTPLGVGYVGNFHLSTVGIGGDGWGVGLVISAERDPIRSIRSAGTGQMFSMHLHAAGLDAFSPGPMPRQFSFIDAAAGFTLHAWAVERSGSDLAAAYSPGPIPLGSLGIGEGTNAAQLANTGPLLRSGEATDPVRPIAHALAGPARRFWKAMVYPATNWDAWVAASDGGDGLVPYGGLLRLDPKIDLKALNLPLPAFRILEAFQSYGWYFIGTGVRDLDIWSSATGAEFEPYGGVEAIDRAIEEVLRKSRLEVALPRFKK